MIPRSGTTLTVTLIVASSLGLIAFAADDQGWVSLFDGKTLDGWTVDGGFASYKVEGGAWGYTDFLEANSDPKHPDHRDMKEWIGGKFDPEKFSLDKVNKQLRQAF